jgi:UDP-N-acetylglucosamine--N-acetylmuramyl-(pentapeptide) pyrophosphoryl-undecaprenol N-acetylglucosamine transferase
MRGSGTESKSLLIAAGGTGGHIFPALAVWEEISRRQHDLSLVWLGSSHRMEKDLIPARGIEFVGLRQTEFRRRPTPGNILYNIRSLGFLAASVLHSARIIKKLKPRLVLTTGGFAGGAAGLAAWLTRTPLIIMEPNAFPGLTNRFLGKRAAMVFIAYPGAKRYFPTSKARVVGSPVRRDVVEKDRNTARSSLGLDDDTLFLLAMGGSQGADGINKNLPEALRLITIDRPDLRFRAAHQCGRGKTRNLTVDRRILPEDRYSVFEFIDDTPTYLAAADIIVARAGASTLSEIACRKLPSVLVPYPQSAEDHQVKNARSWESAGAAFCIEEKDLSPSSLATALLLLMTDSAKRTTMGNEASRFGDPKAAERIVDVLEAWLKD